MDAFPKRESPNDAFTLLVQPALGPITRSSLCYIGLIRNSVEKVDYTKWNIPKHAKPFVKKLYKPQVFACKSWFDINVAEGQVFMSEKRKFLGIAQMVCCTSSVNIQLLRHLTFLSFPILTMVLNTIPTNKYTSLSSAILCPKNRGWMAVKAITHFFLGEGIPCHGKKNLNYVILYILILHCFA